MATDGVPTTHYVLPEGGIIRLNDVSIHNQLGVDAIISNIYIENQRQCIQVQVDERQGFFVLSGADGRPVRRIEIVEISVGQDTFLDLIMM